MFDIYDMQSGKWEQVDILPNSTSFSFSENFIHWLSLETNSLETHSTKHKVEKDFKSACMPLDLQSKNILRTNIGLKYDLKYMSHTTHSFTVIKSEIWQGYVLWSWK